MEAIILIGVGIVLFLSLNLRNRVGRLEKEVFATKGKEGAESEREIPPPVSLTSAPSTPETPFVSREDQWIEEFGRWLKEDWLLKLGALLLLIGFGWFATYAFLNNWIGPIGRIALGIFAGVCILLLGWWRMRTHIHQGNIFLVLGSTVILLTVFAARMVYGFFTPATALGIMFLSAVFVAVASVKYKVKSLALASLILAGIVPLLTGSADSPNTFGLLSYLLVVVLGAIWIVVLTGWRELVTAALLIVAFWSSLFLSAPFRSLQEILLPFVYAFSALFFVAHTLGLLKLTDKKIIPDLITAGGNGLFLLAWIMVAAQEEWKSLIISAWMIVFAVGAFTLFKITQKREPFYVYVGVGIAMLAAATAAELQGAALTIAFTIESGMIAFITYALLRDMRLAEIVSLLFVGPILLSLQSIDSRLWHTSVIHDDFFVLLVLGLTLFGLGTFFRFFPQQGEKSHLGSILLVAGSLYGYVLLWLSLQAAFVNDDTGIMIALFIYTVIGLVAYFYGGARDKKGLRLYGAVLLGFVVGRLLLIDAWRMELTGRIITFFGVGVLLMTTAFFGRSKHKEKLHETPR